MGRGEGDVVRGGVGGVRAQFVYVMTLETGLVNALD